jgi:stage II sporulation protein D
MDDRADIEDAMNQLVRRPAAVPAIAALLSAGLFAIIASGCEVGPPNKPHARQMLPAQMRVRAAGKIVDVPIEEYVLGSVLAEVSPVGERAATIETVFEVQAIVARSYAASHLGRHGAEGFDLCDGTHCQLYEPQRIARSTFAAAARRAVERTAGVVLTYNDQPVEALFHADCGGRTASADDVWGGAAIPYLLSEPDSLPSVKHRSWQVALSASQLLSAMTGDARAKLGRTLDKVRIARRDASGRATFVELDGDRSQLLRGEEFRALVNQRFGGRMLQSTRFTVRETAGTYVFDGTGYGHGVGLCQLGALNRARRGDSVGDIVRAYFHGAQVVKIAG